MAILALQAPVSGIRGKVGGVVYSANGSGPYLKAWGKGSNPRSERQTTHRANLVIYSQSWREITAGERTDWDTYAALPAQDKENSLGETYSASGFAWFIQINLARRQVGDAQLDSAPTVAVPPAAEIDNVILRVTGGSPNSRISLDSGSVSLLENHIVRAQILNSQGIGAVAEIRTFIINEIPNAFDNLVYQDEIEEQFGNIQLGQIIFGTVAVQNSDGRQGPLVSFTANAVS